MLRRHHIQVALAHHHGERLPWLRRHPHRRLRRRRHRTDRIRVDPVGNLLARVDCLVFGLLATSLHGRVDTSATWVLKSIFQGLVSIIWLLGPDIYIRLVGEKIGYF